MGAPIDPPDLDRTITISAADARQIAHFLSLLLEGQVAACAEAGFREGEGAVESQGTEGRAVLIARAKAVLFERQRRTRFFPSVLFGELGWDMLLWLYVTDYEGERQTIGHLASFVGAPHTTALRWIGCLEKERLIEKIPHPTDRRTMFVHLLESGRDRLDRWFSAFPEPLA